MNTNTSDGHKLRHIAFIMDGNGRWAKARMMPREFGHRQGSKNFEKVVHHCFKRGIEHVTVYAFSTENIKRPEKEVKAIMQLLEKYVKKATDEIDKNNNRSCFIGDHSIYSEEMKKKVRYLEDATKDKRYTLNVAINYGGRAELVHAFNDLMSQGKTDITEADISKALYTCDSPDPDLIVRTGGDLRISNFLLWQAAYAEFYFTDTYWPDFSEKELDEIIDSFGSRNRRFGGV